MLRATGPVIFTLILVTVTALSWSACNRSAGDPGGLADERADYPFNSVSRPETVLVANVDVSASSFYWFMPYRSADFPEVETEKRYFALWSTDHDEDDGGIWWGDFDRLDLSDFREIGLITSGHQSETPWLIRNPSDPEGEKLYLFFHPDRSHPDNDEHQQTRLLTSAGGGKLHLLDWHDRGNVLGLKPEDKHTGYLSVHPNADSSWTGLHLVIGGSPGLYGRSSSEDGRVWKRDSTYWDVDSYMPPGRKLDPTNITFFTRDSVRYAVALNKSRDAHGLTYEDQFVGLAIADEDYRVYDYMGLIWEDEPASDVRAFVADGRVHFYLAGPNTRLRYAAAPLKSQASIAQQL